MAGRSTVSIVLHSDNLMAAPTTVDTSYFDKSHSSGTFVESPGSAVLVTPSAATIFSADSSPATSVAGASLQNIPEIPIPPIPTSPPRNTSVVGRSRRVSLARQRMKTLSNPVDSAIIDTMLQSVRLDVLSGYAPEKPLEVKQLTAAINLLEGNKKGYQLLREPILNRGTSTSPKDRQELNLTGLLPHVMETQDIQCMRAMKMIRSRQTGIDKYLYLSNIKSTNIDLFYRLLMDNAKELMPIVYTPTIGDVCLQYSTIFTKPEALYISIKQRASLVTILKNWPYPHPEICVVTDGSRILGLGDLGINGVGIPIGKLALYVAAAGIEPEKTLPIVLDLGTENEENLRDPLYLGLRQRRVPKPEALEFMDEFMAAAASVYPDMIIQFEDFETDKAFHYLDRYRHDYKSFNDDVQGTGAVILSGYMNAVRLSNVPLQDQRLVFMGAGSAGVGVAKQVMEYYTRQGLSEMEAKSKFYLVDTKGLVTLDRGDRLAEHKKFFARTDNAGHQFKTLEDVIEYVRPTALLGLAATFGIFTESVVRALKVSVDAGGMNRRPILFPLSNPLTKAECTFQQAIDWTEGTVIFASGSPFPSYTPTNGGGVTYQPGQGNNVYIFPGLGKGAILAKATKITDEMVYSSAVALANCLNAEEIAAGLIYPRIERVRDASVAVAREVMKAARREGVSKLDDNLWREWSEWGDVVMDQWIQSNSYDPDLSKPIQMRSGGGASKGLWGAK
ncbi:hypothetical protein TWF106_011168 [Orbilia oligospora]|uniref:Malic enzyme n=2 Tax=Orbilia oligospora TaxID=2813651 RepID=A0A6G1MI58_ORBOL|nr:hypothetical protein TWF679_008684 [Orbilia oligospora]KAF3226756.1 hypothetical protein TWF106_011168 [Orbilia oligospora]KAF3229477.1 hypothetical protein TWF191_001199 [Orbilia oligospora]KAF3258378.1 hypothetical protein TWF192_000509 [Orbilia oligospora]